MIPVQPVNEQSVCISSGGPDRVMKRTPRRQRARSKAWCYIVGFGPGEYDTDDSDPSTSATSDTSEARGDEDRDDQDATEP